MPALPMKTLRRKRVLPAAIIAGELSGGPWVDDDYMPNNSFGNSMVGNTAKSSNSKTADMAPQLQVVNGDPLPPARKTWFDLPEELQSQIIEDCTANDLIALSLVSKHFHDLTAQRLYRSFQIIFPDDDDVSFDSSIDSLAAGLETFATSDYNYARFLREVSLDTVTSGSKGERAYRRYTSDESCGKFMNTLMLLAMRQASKLETFQWNIRVELSRPLYKALHSISTLQHLRLRMHPGESSYQKPPPLPSLEDEQEEVVTPRDKNNGVTVGDMLFRSSLRNDKKPAKSKQPVKESTDPPTISGFKSLRTLEVLDMDTLDYIGEVKQAIENSTGTLSKLKISFSENLAREAKKPPAPVDTTDDSEGEMDDFGNGLAPPPPPPPIPSSDDGSGPLKTMQAQEAKKAQEAVLGKLFGIEASHVKKDKETSSEATTVVDDEDKEEAKFEKDGQKFIKNILMISKKLMTSMSPNRTQQQKEALEIIEKAAKKYVEEKKSEEDEKKVEKDKKKDAKENSGESSDAKKSDGAAKDDAEQETDDEKCSGLFDEKEENKKDKVEATDDGANPDDIDVEAPEMVVEEDDVEEATGEADDVPDSTWAEVDAEIARFSEDNDLTPEEQKLFHELLRLSERSQDDTVHQGSANVGVETKTALYELQLVHAARKKAESEEELKVVLEASPDSTASKRAMGEYIRSTRGLQLRSLSIYLIPIKASTLSKAIDIRCLKRITLLNVGPQSAFWTHMAKENDLALLPLQKIQTDNVSPQFLKFVEKMAKCTELFLLERNSKSEVTAQKTEVRIGHIRKALRNQWPHLKRLVIRNENGTWDWDANERFLETLCRRGTNLEELGIAFSSKGVHHLLQDFHGLKNLRALHIIGFRNDDTCHWVLREVRKFIVDIVAHHREMKLEYIAQDNSVERIVWEKPSAKKAKPDTPKVNAKGKGKALNTGSTPASPTSVGAQPPIFPSLTTMVAGAKEEESSSDDDSDDDGSSGTGSLKESRKGLKCKSQEHGKFYDVFGVRMWKKEVLSARV